MASRLYFINVNNVPPEGYFFEAGGERLVGRNYMEFEPRLRALMRKHRIPGLPESVLATFMAPHLADPGRYVRGPAIPKAEVLHQVPDALPRVVPDVHRAHRENQAGVRRGQAGLAV